MGSRQKRVASGYEGKLNGWPDQHQQSWLKTHLSPPNVKNENQLHDGAGAGAGAGDGDHCLPYVLGIQDAILRRFVHATIDVGKSN